MGSFNFLAGDLKGAHSIFAGYIHFLAGDLVESHTSIVVKYAVIIPLYIQKSSFIPTVMTVPDISHIHM